MTVVLHLFDPFLTQNLKCIIVREKCRLSVAGKSEALVYGMLSFRLSIPSKVLAV